MIDVSPTQLQTIQAILKRIAPTCEARVFGSRYQWTAKDYSDLDLAMVGDGKLPFKKLSALRTAFEESDLPYRVDVLDWHAISPEFQKVIERGYEVIQEAKMDVSSNGWVNQKLGEVCEINQSKRNSNWNYPIIEYIDISSVGVGYFVEEPSRIPTQEAPSRAQRLVQDGDTIISTVRPNRRSMLYIKSPKQNTVVSTGFAVLHPKKIDPRFLYYVVFNQEFTDHLAARADGSAYPAVLPEVIAGTEIDLPPLPEQRAIAGILSALDDKIELNRRMNRTLESMARAVFRQWFVEGEEVGDWEIVPLPEIVEVNPTRSLKKGEVAPYLDMANMPTQGHRGIEWIDRPFGSGTKFVNGDTLLARITPCLENGKTAFVDFLKGGQVGWGSTEYIVFHPKPPLPPEYGYYLARSEELRSHAIQNMTGTSGRQRTPASCFDNYLVSVPPADLAEKFGEFAKSVIDKVRANDEESRTLASLRDSLLLKLMRGEVRVK
jgi:type I restriction enzyme S subunit